MEEFIIRSNEADKLDKVIKELQPRGILDASYFNYGDLAFCFSLFDAFDNVTGPPTVVGKAIKAYSVSETFKFKASPVEVWRALQAWRFGCSALAVATCTLRQLDRGLSLRTTL